MQASIELRYIKFRFYEMYFFVSQIQYNMDMTRAQQSKKSPKNVSSKESKNTSTGVPVLDREIGEPRWEGEGGGMGGEGCL